MGVGNPAPSPTDTTTTTPTVSGSGNTFDASKIAFMGGAGVKADPNQYFQSVWAMIGEQGRKQIAGTGAKQFDYGKLIKEQKKEEEKNPTATETLQGIQTLTGSVQGILDGINKLGFDIPEEITEMIGVLQTIASIVSAISAISAIPFLANGGVIKAAGGTVTGNTYSGDQIPAMLNAGEVVLNRAQVGNLASQLTGGGLAGLQLEAVVRGEDLRFIINSNGRRTGRGEIVTTNFR